MTDKVAQTIVILHKTCQWGSGLTIWVGHWVIDPQLVSKAFCRTWWSDPVGLHFGNKTFSLARTALLMENPYPSSHPEVSIDQQWSNELVPENPFNSHKVDFPLSLVHCALCNRLVLQWVLLLKQQGLLRSWATLLLDIHQWCKLCSNNDCKSFFHAELDVLNTAGSWEREILYIYKKHTVKHNPQPSLFNLHSCKQWREPLIWCLSINMTSTSTPTEWILSANRAV